MPNLSLVQRLKSAGDLAGLVRTLRHPTDAGLRREAAAALADLGSLEPVEMLIRAHLQDPDQVVRSAARTALVTLIGNDTDLAIQTYHGGPPDIDPWLLEARPRAAISTQQPSADQTQVARLRRLKDTRDLDGLVELLRTPGAAERRIQAAAAIGELLNVSAAEPLARTAQQDPEPAVRQAARTALQNLVGSQADLVIAHYRQDSDADYPWLRAPADVEGEGIGPDILLDAEAVLADGADFIDISDWDLDDINGMIAVLAGETDLKLRLGAIRALRLSRNYHAMDALALTALWSDEPLLRQAARDALDEVFGDEAAEFLESYRRQGGEVDEENAEEDLFDDDEDDEDYEEDEEEDEGVEPYAPTASDFQQTSSAALTRPSAVLREDRPPWRWILVFGGLFVLLAAVMILLTIK